MKIKKKILFPIIALLVLGGIYLINKTVQLKAQLTTEQQAKIEMTERIDSYEQLGRIDSLLVKGDYDAAIASYRSTLDIAADNVIGLPLRIELAEKLANTKVAFKPKNDDAPKTDTISIPSTTTAKVREMDSLRFSLEKTKVQLTRLRGQLKQKSFGEYLQFQSKKKNQMHYVGQVKNGKANGYGIALLDTGSRYEGGWQDNKRSGRGTFYWADGQHYEGGFANDMRNGLGTYYWPNKEKYVGQWKDDMRNGQGVFYGADGKVVAKGSWENDKLVKDDKNG